MLVGAALVLILFLPWLPEAQAHARAARPILDYAAGLALAILGGLAIRALPLSTGERRALLVVWTARVVVALGFMLVYEAHYPGLDAFNNYYARALGPWPGIAAPLDGTDNVVRLSWVVARLLPFYQALKIVFVAIGFAATFLFYRAAKLAFPATPISAIYVLGLVPSILFWSSIIGKDPIVFLGISCAAYAGAALFARQLRAALWPALAALILLTLVRVWLVVVCGGALVVLAVALAWKGRGWTTRVALLAALSLGAVLAAMLLARHFGASSPDAAVGYIDRISRSWATGGSGQTPPAFESWGDVLRFLPLGMFTALFRPLPGDVSSAFGLLAGLESLAFLLVFAVSVGRTRGRHLRQPLILATLTFLLLWSVLYSYVSYQNLGTAVRFRLQAIPALVGYAALVARTA